MNLRTAVGSSSEPASPRPRAGGPTALTPLAFERITVRARAIWLASGCLPGRDEQNWHEAEAQLEAEGLLE